MVDNKLSAKPAEFVFVAGVAETKTSDGGRGAVVGMMLTTSSLKR